MKLRALPLVLAAAGLGAQEYFTEPQKNAWVPAWEFTATKERIDLLYPAPDIDRTRSRLRLRWTFGEDSDTFQFKVGSASYLGSDSNATNLRWFDNEPSNGSRLDVAALRFQMLGSALGFRAEGGLVENPLISSESLWDPDLRVIGGGGSLFWRNTGGGSFQVDEVSARGVAGKVRLLDGGRVDLRAGQVVLKASGGGVEVTLHGGAWNLEARQEDAPLFRRQNPADPYGNYLDPVIHLNVYGVGVSLPFTLPLELKAIRHTNRDTQGRGEEFQAWLGSPTRLWWPQFGYIRQRIDETSALASVNGDSWWYHADTDGQRYVAALNLPDRWRIELSRVVQTWRDAQSPIHRDAISLVKRF
jgi:hypothetical protein